MSKAGPTVSVVIPAFNSATTLPRAVDSVLQQDLQDFELLIVNDGSTDATGEVARERAADPRVRVISLAMNSGKPYAMNAAIREVRGRWIAVLDADDWYADKRLSVLVSAGERQGVQLVADNQWIYDEGADQIIGAAFDVVERECPLNKAAFASGCDPYADFDFGMLKPVVSTSFVREVGLTYRENARLSEDFLYLLEFFAAGGEGLMLSEPLYYWRQAFGTISRRWTGTARGAWRYDFLSGVQATSEVLSVMRAREQGELTELLERRVQAFQRLHRLQEFSRLRATGANPIHLALNIARYPSIWPLVIQKMLRRVGQRRSQITTSCISAGADAQH